MAAEAKRRAKSVTGEYKKELLATAKGYEKLADEMEAVKAHNAAVAVSSARNEAITTTRRVVAVPIVKPAPFDPQAGRGRTARPLPGVIRRPGYEGMPDGAPETCPRCGAAQPSYGRYGRYICAVDRLSRKGVGCGHIFDGPMTPSEAQRLRDLAPRLPPDPGWTRSQMYGMGYPEPPREFVAERTTGGNDDISGAFD